MNPKYPHITVTLIGKPYKGFYILLSVVNALRTNNIPEPECQEFLKEASSEDIHHLIRVCLAWVTIE